MGSKRKGIKIFLGVIFCKMSLEYRTQEFGEEFTEDHRVYITQDGKIISPFHDIEIYPTDSEKIVNVVNEIPRFTNAKLEINKEEKMNPIKQDTKNGKVRFITNVFPKKGYIWNYGAIPQTWESTEVEDKLVGCKGDNDPIDAIEIGSATKRTGEVYRAKILGGIAMIDGGECDWKILVIDTADEMSKTLNDIEDVKKNMPGFLEETREWFRNYKMPAGSPPNKFACNEEYIDSNKASEIVKETHAYWKKLVQEKEHEGISLANTSQKGTPGHTSEFKAEGPEFKSRKEPKEAQGFYFLKE